MIVCAADKSFEEGQTPHRVSKFYYMVDSVDIVGAANEAFGGISMEIDGVVRRHQGWEDWQITSVLDNKKYMVQVQRAIQCHRSDRKSTRLNSSHIQKSRMPSSA